MDNFAKDLAHGPNCTKIPALYLHILIPLLCAQCWMVGLVTLVSAHSEKFLCNLKVILLEYLLPTFM